MKQRLNYSQIAPEAMGAMYGLERYIRKNFPDHKLLDLVYLRASQINGCAFCVDMHTKDARAKGETEQRLYAVAVWQEAPFFTERERAALTWTEAVTLVSETRVPDDVYELARRHFSEPELVALTVGIVAINGWNRLSVSFRTLAGTYEPQPERKAA